MLSSPAPLLADRIGEAGYRMISAFGNSIADVIVTVSGPMQHPPPVTESKGLDMTTILSIVSALQFRSAEPERGPLPLVKRLPRVARRGADHGSASLPLTVHDPGRRTLCSPGTALIGAGR